MKIKGFPMYTVSMKTMPRILIAGALLVSNFCVTMEKEPKIIINSLEAGKKRRARDEDSAAIRDREINAETDEMIKRMEEEQERYDKNASPEERLNVAIRESDVATFNQLFEKQNVKIADRDLGLVFHFVNNPEILHALLQKGYKPFSKHTALHDVMRAEKSSELISVYRSLDYSPLATDIDEDEIFPKRSRWDRMPLAPSYPETPLIALAGQAKYHKSLEEVRNKFKALTQGLTAEELKQLIFYREGHVFNCFNSDDKISRTFKQELLEIGEDLCKKTKKP